ncbi:ABC transporter permease subunit [Kitasatospora sp. NPDC050543]|uniref:ABC transporter permease subunit n=1 Tax=Kitasatospora sp. NPDC050543 TaxID=3364054 RepID=UPI00379DBF1E
MSTLASAAPAAAPAADTADGTRTRFGDLVAAEWIKTRSLRSTPWLLAFTVLFVIGCAALAALADASNLAHMDPGRRATMSDFLVFDAYPPPAYMTLMLVAGSLGAISVVSEYSSGLIATTTVAVPARGSVVLAKAVVMAVLWTVVGTVTAIGSFAVAQAVLHGQHAGVPFTHPGVLRAMVASALLAPVCALIGLGLGVLIRHSAATMVTSAVTLLMLPLFFSTSRRWSADINHAMVSTAWKRLVQNWEPQAHSLGFDATVGGSWTVYVLWPLVAIVLAVVFVRRRDV